ncbi:hypothetical protein FACS189419_05960 [Planctomycetales bacterium]|nr:hypothetical protein FACS189419_05960 [Planctomycetales bacterium]
MTFEKTPNNWRMERNGRAVLKDGALNIQAESGQPVISKFVDQIGGEFTLAVELKTSTESQADLYWTSRGSPRRDEASKVTQTLQEDGNWHTYEFIFNVQDYLDGLALRFSKTDGAWAIRSMKLIRKSPPPFSVGKIVPFQYKPPASEAVPSPKEQEMLRFTVRNDVAVPMKYKIDRQPEELTLEKDGSVDLAAPIKTTGNLAAVVLTLHPQEFPDVIYPVFLYRPEGKTEWIRREITENKMIEVDPHGQMARLLYNGEIVAVIAPLVHRSGAIPVFTLAKDSGEKTLHFESADTDLRLEIDNIIRFSVKDTGNKNQGDLEAVAVRLFGKLRSGLLPGVEFLGNGDVSSSPIDIAPPLNDRSIPNRTWITQPLAVLETEKAGFVLRWKDLTLQPTFSAPNRFDQTDDHRMSLRGTNIEASLEFLMPTQSTDSSAAMRVLKTDMSRFRFPELPKAPRTSDEQFQLCLQALAGHLQTDTGGEWGYALDADWQRKPFADFFSTLIRLNELGQFRDLTFPGLSHPKTITRGGADITNDVIYFLTDRVSDWQKERKDAMQTLLTMQNPDGSFMYRTRFPEVETAAGSFGHTALQALKIMEYTRLTGDDDLYAAVKKSLDYLQRCTIPNGGFYENTPFHTPDLQTAAALVWLYLWAYEYERKPVYLERAVYFAYAGLPFVYLTGTQREQIYLTVPKFGGVERGKPFDFGVTRTRTGIQYAYALNLLSKYDSNVDWKKIAWGILQAVERIQFTDGNEIGCIPQQYDVIEQKPLGWKINPCALVSLRLVLEGKPESLFLFKDGKDRYVSPYPLRKTKDGVKAVNVPNNRKFQLLLNGSRIGRSDDSGTVQVD